MKTIIANPRITEKGSNLMAGNVYTFDVTPSANKNEIKKAIFQIYKVHPIRVNILKFPRKNVLVRGRPNTRGGGRKAYVYLKEGDKIEFI